MDPKLFEARDLVDGGVSLYIEEEAKSGQVIGYDPKLHSPDALGWMQIAAEKAGAILKPVGENPVDVAWAKARPDQPAAPVTPHPAEYSGESSALKRARVGEAVVKAGADVAVITAPASIAWLFNVRGGDVIRSPLPIGQAILRADGTAELFLEPTKVTETLPTFLGNQVTLTSPEALPQALSALKGRKVFLDPAQSSAWYFDTLEAAGAEVIRGADPCMLPRACKNAVEVEGARKAHRRDGAALTRFLHWLATEAQSTLPDEVEIVSRLESFREATGLLKDLSFDTIAGAGPNGAVVHYRPTLKTNRKVRPGDLLLVDSGGQYLDGTTDVTRTVSIGEPSEEMRERFTLVLRGHVALARVRFPAGTTGSSLDVLARAPLWDRGLDFDHGTGHGVGSYLGVHEGPHRIAKAPNTVALRPGMIVSNEPGYYKTGAYGIRIENLQVVVEPVAVPGGERPMLAFETLTLAPIDRRLIDKALMTVEERIWLDAYHQKVSELIAPLVEGEVREWLLQACAPL